METEYNNELCLSVCWVDVEVGHATESNCNEVELDKDDSGGSSQIPLWKLTSSYATHFLLRRCVSVGHILPWGFHWIQSCLKGISERCRSLTHNLIITCKVPNPYSTGKTIWQTICLCLWSIRITCLIYNYLLLKSVSSSLWNKNALLAGNQFPEEPVTYSCATQRERIGDIFDLNPDKSIWRSVPRHSANLWDRKHNIRQHKGGLAQKQ